MAVEPGTGAPRAGHVACQFSPSAGGLEDAVRNLTRDERDIPGQVAASLDVIEATGRPAESRKLHVGGVGAFHVWPAASAAYDRVYRLISRRPVARAGQFAAVGS